MSRKESSVGAALEKTSTTAPTPGSGRPMTAKASTPVTGSSLPTTRDRKDSKPSAFTSNKNLEEETERDIRLARKRREANDRYFSQVDRGVLEVVSKLDEVAGAMRRVERESREIWDESSDSEEADEMNVTGEEETDGDEDAEGDGGSATGLTDSPVSILKER